MSWAKREHCGTCDRVLRTDDSDGNVTVFFVSCPDCSTRVTRLLDRVERFLEGDVCVCGHAAREHLGDAARCDAWSFTGKRNTAGVETTQGCPCQHYGRKWPRT